LNGRVIADCPDQELISYSSALEYLNWLDFEYPQLLEKIQQRLNELEWPSNLVVRISFVEEVNGPFVTPLGNRIPVLEIGNPSPGSKRLVFEATCHGGERLHSATLLAAFFSLVQNAWRLQALLESSFIGFLPIVDPDGWVKETRAYVDRSGEEIHNPVVVNLRHIRNMFGWEDANAAFGRKLESIRSRRAKAVQQYVLKRFNPLRVFSSLHETVMLGSELFYKNAGVMILLHDYFTQEEKDLLARLRYPLGMFQRSELFLRKRFSFRFPKYREEFLSHHPFFAKALSIRNFIKKQGLTIFQDKFEAALKELPFYVERDLPLAEGIYLPGPFFWKTGITLAPDFFQKMTGCCGRTIETFTQSRETRLMQGLAFVDATLRVEVRGEHF